MRGPYTGDLRIRVIEFVEAGGSRREAAEQFQVSASSAIRWVQRFREDGTSPGWRFRHIWRMMKTAKLAFGFRDYGARCGIPSGGVGSEQRRLRNAIVSRRWRDFYVAAQLICATSSGSSDRGRP
jgi:hypothetical protein